MKPSGIEWIGDIPDDWEVTKISRLYSIQLGKMLQPEKKSSGDTYEPYICAANLSSGTFRLDEVKYMWISEAEKDIYRLKCDDLLVTEGGDVGISSIWKDDISPCYFQNALHRVVPKKGNSNRFLHYWLIVLKSVGYIDLICNKSTIAHFTKEKFAQSLILSTPLRTQQRIADYLDEKCGEIDATIAKQKESIEKLKAYKQSLISETVTKGLDKSAPLKPSGIDYLGDIPAHWEVKRIKELFSFGKGLPISKEDLIENGVPVINYGQIHSKDNNGTSIKDSLIRYVDLNYKNTNMTSLVESGDFIFADTSEDLDGCGNCIYVDSKYPIFAGYHCIILRSIKRNSSKYLAYLFQMDAWRTQIRRDVTGVKVFSISKKILGKSYILFPPRYEQECIVNYLQEKCNEIDVIINKKQNIIQKLDAYKKSLIFECVTGKFVI